MGRSLLLAAAIGLAGCTTHAFAQKTPDGKVYLNGTSGFLFFQSSFIKRCTESGTTLTCERLTVVDVGTEKSDDASEPAPKPKPKKKKPADDSDDSDDAPKKKPKKPPPDSDE